MGLISLHFFQETYDPHCWGPESYYEELGNYFLKKNNSPMLILRYSFGHFSLSLVSAKRQKEEMDKREKEKKERTKVRNSNWKSDSIRKRNMSQ